MSRPKTQESPPQSKIALISTQSGDLQSRCGTNATQSKQQEKSVAEISMRDFLDFLKISYQVNEAVDNPSGGFAEKSSVDWKKLTSDILINRLKEREAAISRGQVAKSEPGENPGNIFGEKTHSDSESSGKTLPRRKSLEEKNSEGKLAQEGLTDDQTSLERRPSTLSLDRKIVSEKSKRPTRKKGHGFKKEGSVESETSRSLEGPEERAPARLLKKKLNEVLQEGILDSVLPYLIPKQPQQTQENGQHVAKKPQPFEVKKPGGGIVEKNEKSTFGSTAKELRRRSLGKNDFLDKNDKKDIEVVIHVCDELKNLKRDFRCSQKLLVSQMGYFAEVTTGQRLEDMDISVHCDVSIFDWLMRWMQKDRLSEEHWPTLDSSIVIPVLMSSAFLQMNSLQEHCLHYCKTHINDIVRDSPNLSCVNDNVLTRLANFFSNTEIENIVDKKDKIQSKLFCKLIASLSEPEPQPQRGHYSSLATMYRCSKCLKLILRNMSSRIVCVASNMKLDRNGTLLSTHAYDSSWNLTSYVRDLKAELKSWRRVYWRLWADCHFLFCQACEELFPVHHMSWCRFHAEPVQYFPVENQRSVCHSIGRYPCCGERSYRFEVVKKNLGCQYRNHVPSPRTAGDVEVLRIWNFHKDVIKDDPPPPLPNERIKLSKSSGEPTVRDGFWWEGLELIPSKQPAGLLTKIWDTIIKKEDYKTARSNSECRNQRSPVSKTATGQQAGVQDLSSFSDSSDDCSSSSNAENSEESYHSSAKVAQKYKNSGSINSHLVNNRHEGNRFWMPRLSTRCNQDNQREFEERALRQIESSLAKKLSGESFRTAGSRSSYQVVPAGGVYVKLEQEWREAHCFSHGCPGSSIKARGSASYVHVNSSYSVQKRSKSRCHR